MRQFVAAAVAAAGRAVTKERAAGANSGWAVIAPGARSVSGDLAAVDVQDSTWYKFTNVCPDRDVGSTDQPPRRLAVLGGGGSATGCSDPPRTQHPVRFPLNHALREHASRLTAHHGRPASGSRPAASWPGGSRDRPAHRPVIPSAASQVTVGRGRAAGGPFPAAGLTAGSGGCGLRDRPHRRLRPGRGAITSVLGLARRWPADPQRQRRRDGPAPRPGRHDHRAGPASHRDLSRGGRRCGRLRARAIRTGRRHGPGRCRRGRRRWIG